MTLINMFIDLSINPTKTAKDIIQFIKISTKNAGFSKVILGLSGGIDSAVSLYLSIEALGVENIHVGIFPYGELNIELKNNALTLTKECKLPIFNIHIIDISPFTDSINSTDSKMDNLRRGNIMARIRMILLYDLSKKIKGLVMGTENKTESLLGYYTRFGDEASDIEPIINLYKTQVKQLARYLQIPEKIINQVPTAGMWKGQTDEGELDFSYEDADKILFLYTKGKKIDEMIKCGFDKKIVNLVINKLLDNKFKKEVPYRL